MGSDFQHEFIEKSKKTNDAYSQGSKKNKKKCKIVEYEGGLIAGELEQGRQSHNKTQKKKERNQKPQNKQNDRKKEKQIQNGQKTQRKIPSSKKTKETDSQKTPKQIDEH